MQRKHLLANFRNPIKLCNLVRQAASYVQGQSPEPKIREYFYYIDHEGMLFLDDARIKNFTSCFKEKKFLEFFYRRLKLNDTKRYDVEFPYLSLCGRERNFIRCDDLPIVYTHHVMPKAEGGAECLAFGHAGDVLLHEFQPDRIFMSPATGRVYHPAEKRYGSIGLVRSKLAIEMSKHFVFTDGEEKPPTQFVWHGTTYQLDQNWIRHTIKLHANYH